MLPPFVCSQEIHAPPCLCLQACKCVTTEPRVSQESVSIKMGTLTLRCAAHHLLELPVPLADTHILSELNPSFCALAVHLWLFKICKNNSCFPDECEVHSLWDFHSVLAEGSRTWTQTYVQHWKHASWSLKRLTLAAVNSWQAILCYWDVAHQKTMSFLYIKNCT